MLNWEPSCVRITDVEDSVDSKCVNFHYNLRWTAYFSVRSRMYELIFRPQNPQIFRGATIRGQKVVAKTYPHMCDIKKKGDIMQQAMYLQHMMSLRVVAVVQSALQSPNVTKSHIFSMSSITLSHLSTNAGRISVPYIRDSDLWVTQWPEPPHAQPSQADHAWSGGSKVSQSKKQHTCLGRSSRVQLSVNGNPTDLLDDADKSVSLTSIPRNLIL